MVVMESAIVPLDRQDSTVAIFYRLLVATIDLSVTAKR